MNGDQLALVLAATIPAAITAGGGIWLAKASKGVRDKVAETHHQVTVNSHESDQPTVLDRIAEVGDIAQAALDAALTTELRTHGIARKLDEHLDWSDKETRNIWRAVWYAFRNAKERGEDLAPEPPE